MEPLKNIYTREFIQHIAVEAAAVIADFDAMHFEKQVLDDDWNGMELKQRMKHISRMLAMQLSGDFLSDLAVVVLLTERLHRVAGRENMLEYMFLPEYVEQFGAGHINEAMDAMEKITVLASCEFAIRPFIQADPLTAIEKMYRWTTHPHPSVRRLASEGCRPRLPWGMALPVFKKDPSPILPILRQLRNDESLFVRKSVANNLNDIAKDNPHITLDIARRWKGESAHADWIIRHGCRTLLKKGDEDAMEIFGLKASALCVVSDLRVAAGELPIGDTLEFSFSVANLADVPATLRIDYVIGYVKANGAISSKVFRVTEKLFLEGERINFRRRQSVADMTTRKHYPGRHTLSVVVNGKAQATIDFELVSP